MKKLNDTLHYLILWGADLRDVKDKPITYIRRNKADQFGRRFGYGTWVWILAILVTIVTAWQWAF